MYNVAWAGLPVTPTSTCGTAAIQTWNSSLNKNRPLVCFLFLNLIANPLSFFVVVVEVLLSIPVRLEILINLSNVLYFQCDTGSGFIYARCQNFSNWRCISKNYIICSSLLCALWQQDRRFTRRRLPDAVERAEEVFSSELGWVLVPYQANKVLAL